MIIDSKDVSTGKKIEIQNDFRSGASVSKITFSYHCKPFFNATHIETFFQNTTTGSKLNNHVILHVHCRKIDQRNMIEVAKV